MRKSYEWFVVKEWLLLPVSIYEALRCPKPYRVIVMMEDVPEQNKILPYKIVMSVLDWRCR